MFTAIYTDGLGGDNIQDTVGLTGENVQVF
jgi:hypothetical protein